MNEIIRAVALVVLTGAALAVAAVIIAGVSRCRRCGGWCVDKADCAERQRSTHDVTQRRPPSEMLRRTGRED